ncbi:MAG: TetR/AcrR family transcriptional regulator [Acidocella sp.]|nr:TetR/AcrR family transcriptional regulator [Acidocella sp.]
MARTQSADYDQRRELITRQAARLYAQKGFLGASIADISVACHMSKSLIYHYFPSKEDILFAVMWSHVSILAEAARMIAALNRAPEDKLRWLAHTLMGEYQGAQDAHKILLNELDNLPEGKRAVIVHAERQLLDLLDTLLVALRPHLRLMPKQRRPIVMMFFGMLNWTHTWYNTQGPVSAEKIAALAADMWLTGLPRPTQTAKPKSQKIDNPQF